MKKLRNIILAFLLCMSFQVVPVHAVSISIPVLSQEPQTTEVEKEKMNILEDIRYRLFEKDTKDGYDYLLLAIFSVGLLMVMVLQNTHSVESSSPRMESVMEKEQIIEEKLEENSQEIAEENLEESEILSSDLLEESEEEKQEEPTREKTNYKNHKKKNR